MKAFLIWVILIVCAIVAWPLTVTFAFFVLLDWLMDGEVFGAESPFRPKKK